MPRSMLTGAQENLDTLNTAQKNMLKPFDVLPSLITSQLGTISLFLPLLPLQVTKGEFYGALCFKSQGENISRGVRFLISP